MKFLVSMKMALVLLFSLGAMIGVATFIENDFGTQTAQAVVYKAKWFEVFLGYFLFVLVYNMLKYKSYRSKPAVFLFHASFVVIGIGAFITRYIGYEGTMSIREGNMSHTMISSEKVLQMHAVEGDKSATFEKALYFSTMTPNHFHESFQVGGQNVQVELYKYMPTAHEIAVPSQEGKKLLELKISTGKKGEIYYIAKGERKDFGGFYLGYEITPTTDKPTFLITDSQEGYKVNFPFMLTTLNMDDRSSGELKGGENEFHQRMLYRFGPNAVVLKDIHEKAVVKLQSNDIKTQAGEAEYMEWKVTVGNKSEIVTTRPMKDQVGQIKQLELNGVHVDMRVGAKEISIPFSIKLENFDLERYPGSMTPASYSSDVVLLDEEEGINMPYKIYMNHVLDHRNYRFFQSSYDQDEKGTILSVNHDPGALPTYIGYILLTIGMIWSLFSTKGRFQYLLKGTKKLQASVAAVALTMLFAWGPQNLQASDAPTVDPDVLQTMQKYDRNHAANFGKVAVQDFRGRMKPMDTVAHEVIAKVTGKSKLYDLEPTQMFLGMVMQPELYQGVPMIKIGHKKIAVVLGLPEDAKYAKFTDFFTTDTNDYKIFNAVSEASKKKPLEQSQYDKELIKIDERVNVAFMAYQGSLLAIYPKPEDDNNKWMAPLDAIKNFPAEHAEFVKMSISAYFQNVAKGLQTGEWKDADMALNGIRQYQEKFGAAVIPSADHIEWEIKYNQFGLFGKLVPVYLLLGLFVLILAFINVINPRFSLKWVMRLSVLVLLLGFVAHVTGLAIRWYIAGHAPWSNAYESIVFIAASTVLAGIILARRSPFALAGTAILAGVTMGVAHMNFINPEITTLVPVLKSYWLMIHVATIISGDGFLGLGSILSLLVLILYILRGKGGNENIDRSIKELTNLSEMGLLVGLMLLTVGNFLGGVWANESWGRYWGWDSKENWAAVTILIYATVLHLRFVPALKSNFIFNVASLWSYSTVLMTYFGVNYYLRGL
ncbi:MAG: hypothetical protein RLZZ428_12, partial [Pseudomonadota bacterium]